MWFGDILENQESKWLVLTARWHWIHLPFIFQTIEAICQEIDEPYKADDKTIHDVKFFSFKVKSEAGKSVSEFDKHDLFFGRRC